MNQLRYMDETQLSAYKTRLSWKTVKEIKRICPRLDIKATWYNKANKQDLKAGILLQIDKNGFNKQFFDDFLDSNLVDYWSDMHDEVVGSVHFTQLYVRGEQSRYEDARELHMWKSYFPINSYKHRDNKRTSSSLMDQRHHPNREWPSKQEDPKGILGIYIPVSQRTPGSDPITGEPVKEPSMATVQSIQAPVIGGLEGIMSELIKGALADKVESVLDSRGLTKEAVKDVIVGVIMDKALPTAITVPTPSVGGPSLQLVHQNFEAAEFWLSYGYSVYLNGPSGSGKTVAATQLAERFEGELTIISCHGEMTVYDLTGFTDANGQYKQTEFFKAWRDGNIILMDEVDKAPGEVNVLLNAALAQGTLTFPVGTLQRRKATKLLFTGNTKMSGADAIYSAGQRQDASFSNRMISVAWPFDLALEQTLAENECERHGGTRLNGKSAHMRIIKIREKIEEMGMNYVVGQRQSMMLAAAVGTGRSIDVTLEEVVYGWMDPNDADRIRGGSV